MLTAPVLWKESEGVHVTLPNAVTCGTPASSSTGLCSHYSRPSPCQPTQRDLVPRAVASPKTLVRTLSPLDFLCKRRSWGRCPPCVLAFFPLLRFTLRPVLTSVAWGQWPGDSSFLTECEGNKNEGLLPRATFDHLQTSKVEADGKGLSPATAFPLMPATLR